MCININKDVNNRRDVAASPTYKPAISSRYNYGTEAEGERNSFGLSSSNELQSESGSMGN